MQISSSCYIAANLHDQLCAALEPTFLSDVLKGVRSEDQEDFFLKYLEDFVRLAHKSCLLDISYKNVEYRVSKS